MQMAIHIFHILFLTSLGVGGLILRDAVRRKLKAKNAAIESLRAEMEYHKSRSAPSLGEDAATLTACIEESDTARRAIQEKLERLREYLAEECEDRQRTLESAYVHGMVLGASAASYALRMNADVVRRTDLAVGRIAAGLLESNAEAIEAGIVANLRQ